MTVSVATMIDTGLTDRKNLARELLDVVERYARLTRVPEDIAARIASSILAEAGADFSAEAAP